MGLPENNLPSLDGQRYYTHIHDLSDSEKKKVRKQKKLKSCDSHYLGSALSVLRDDDDCKTIARVQRYTYTVQCFDRKDRLYCYASHITIKQRNIESLDDHDAYITMALELAHTQTISWSIVNHLMHAKNLLVTSYKPQQHISLSEQLSKQRNSVNAIYKEKVKVLLSSTNVDDVSSLNAYLNNTYVNIVHDCDRVCVQSVLSDNAQFMQLREVEKYGLLCVNRIQTSDRLSRLQHNNTYNNRAHNSDRAATITLYTFLLLCLGCTVCLSCAAYCSVNNSPLARTIRRFCGAIADICPPLRCVGTALQYVARHVVVNNNAPAQQNGYHNGVVHAQRAHELRVFDGSLNDFAEIKGLLPAKALVENKSEL